MPSDETVSEGRGVCIRETLRFVLKHLFFGHGDRVKDGALFVFEDEATSSQGGCRATPVVIWRFREFGAKLVVNNLPPTRVISSAGEIPFYPRVVCQFLAPLVSGHFVADEHTTEVFSVQGLLFSFGENRICRNRCRFGGNGLIRHWRAGSIIRIPTFGPRCESEEGGKQCG